MNVILCEHPEQATRFAATLVARQVASRPNSVLGWATGGTMERLYQDLVNIHRRQSVGWSATRSFNLDEYIGLSADHPMSYRYFMRNKVFEPLGIPEVRTHLPRGDAADLEQECADYEQAIADAGGIDFQLLGIGENGHIGFNEPHSSLSSRTHITRLSPGTIAANQRFFAPGAQPPEWAITMGITTILECRQIVMLALGEKKARAVAAMLEGPISDACPASALQMHPTTTVVLDRDAAQLLTHNNSHHSAPLTSIRMP